MSLIQKPLSDSLGIEIIGLDFNALTADDVQELVEAWLRYHVVLIRNCGLDEDSQIRLGRCLGEVEHARFKSPLTTHPEIMVITNLRGGDRALGSLPDGELVWHYDRVHQRIPNKAGILHAITLPDHGGETRFVNMCRVYADLPEDLRRRIAGLYALNTYHYGQTRAEDKRLDEGTPSAIHPVVRRLPETGEQALFVCRLMTDSIQGVDEDESRELLERLFQASEHSPHVYEHFWQPDDLLIWDNRCVMHARNDFDGRQQRLLKRVTVADTVAPQP